MRLINAPARQPSRLGILPGSFNPPTCAHLALARAAFDFVDHVLLVVPAVFPHKQYEGASLEQRVEMLARVTAGEPGMSAAVSDRGLFIDIAHEVREHYPAAALYFLCGCDAAERITSWDYGEHGAIERMLEVFHLLVAPRPGDYQPPATIAHAVHRLELTGYDECSATRVRSAVGRNEDWRTLVPGSIACMVGEIYG